MNELLDSEPASWGGWATVLTAIGLRLTEWIGQVTVNDLVQDAAAIGALIFLYYKIRMIRLDYKIKKKNNEDG